MHYFKPYRKESILSPVMKMAEALLELFVPLLVAIIIDVAVAQRNTRLLTGYIMLMLGIGLAGWGVSILAQYYAARSAVGFTRELTRDLFNHSIRLAKWDQDEITRASLVTRLTSDVQQIQTGINLFFRLILRSPFIVFGSLIMASQIDFRMTWAFLGMIAVLTLVIGGLLKLSGPRFVKVQKAMDRLVALTTEQLEGVRVTRAFNQEEREVEDFYQHNQKLKKNQLAANTLTVLTNPLTSVIVNLTLILIIWQGSQWVFQGDLSQGQMVALINYLLQILVELVKLVMVMTTVNRALVSSNRVASILDQPVEPEDFINAYEADSQALFTFKEGELTYPSAQEPALSGLDFSVQPGQLVGVIGGTGAGKSTLVSLLTKTYDLTQGALGFDPNLFNTESRHDLRASISVVPQRAQLFKGTVRSNLEMAYAQASDEEMIQALKRAQAWEFISRDPKGLDAPVEAFGRNFSGGQRQRLTIARALVKPANLLILDDSTSALDYLTEAKLQQAIHDLGDSLTTIMISQRTHSLQRADLIVVLDEGQQVAVGTHEELLDTCQIYQEIHESQAIEEVEEE